LQDGESREDANCCSAGLASCLAVVDILREVLG
jgi:hypothetical protein